MKSLLSILVLALMVSSCDTTKKTVEMELKLNTLERSEKTEVSNASSTESTSNVSDSFYLTESFISEKIKLIYPHSENWGVISIDNNEDAKVLYNSLKVKEEVSVWDGVGKSKEGQNIACFKQFTLKEPNIFTYACSFYIEYRNAKVNNKSRGAVVLDNKVADLQADYIGKDLQINKSDKIATLTLKGDDAKALFLTFDVGLSGMEKDNESFDRKVNMIDCRKGLTSNKYACYIRVDLAKGKVQFPKE